VGGESLCRQGGGGGGGGGGGAPTQLLSTERDVPNHLANDIYCAPSCEALKSRLELHESAKIVNVEGSPDYLLTKRLTLRNINSIFSCVRTQMECKLCSNGFQLPLVHK